MKENQTELTLFRKTEITTADVNMNSNIMMSKVVNLLIQAAIGSADSLGFGFANLIEKKMAWVLSRLSIEIFKPLKWYDIAEVETWPKNVERIFYLRDFIIRNQQNDIVAKATSAWLAIDSETRRPKVLGHEQIELFTRLKDKNALDNEPEKLMKVKGTEEFLQKASYFDIDLNQHVTATRYVDWMMDTFDPEFHKNNFPKSLSINYMKETKYDESVTIERQSNNSEFQFEGTNQNNSTTAFRGKIVF